MDLQRYVDKEGITLNLQNFSFSYKDHKHLAVKAQDRLVSSPSPGRPKKKINEGKQKLPEKKTNCAENGGKFSQKKIDKPSGDSSKYLSVKMNFILPSKNKKNRSSDLFKMNNNNVSTKKQAAKTVISHSESYELDTNSETELTSLENGDPAKSPYKIDKNVVKSPTKCNESPQQSPRTGKLCDKSSEMSSSDVKPKSPSTKIKNLSTNETLPVISPGKSHEMLEKQSNNMLGTSAVLEKKTQSPVKSCKRNDSLLSGESSEIQETSVRESEDIENYQPNKKLILTKSPLEKKLTEQQSPKHLKAAHNTSSSPTKLSRKRRFTAPDMSPTVCLTRVDTGQSDELFKKLSKEQRKFTRRSVSFDEKEREHKTSPYKDRVSIFTVLRRTLSQKSSDSDDIIDVTSSEPFIHKSSTSAPTSPASMSDTLGKKRKRSISTIDLTEKGMK